MVLKKFAGRDFSSEDSSSLPLRENIEEKYKWNLLDIYPDDDKWEADFKWVEDHIPSLKKFEEKLSHDYETLLECLELQDSIGIKLDRLNLYASLSKDSDMRVPRYQAMDDRIKNLATRFSSAAAFIRPEILGIPSDNLNSMIESNEKLKVYRHYINDIIRMKKHTLEKELEAVLASSSDILQVPYDAFSMFTNADIKFPIVKDENGDEVEISHGRYYSAMYSYDREFRKNAYMSYYRNFKDYSNTISVLFNGNLKANIFIAKTRHYNSVREAALDGNNIPLSVYDNLISSVNKNLMPLNRWASIKKRLLGLDELHPYDSYVTLFQDESEKKYSFDEAKEVVLKALSPLGNEYLNSLRIAFDNRWLDVYETKAKRSGAYSSGTTFGVHPFVLLNWTGNLNDVFTLAHEMGHNMHSFYTGKTQPYPYANYSIFLAEVASTFNESLLLDFLIESASSKHEKLYLIEKYLSNITSTFYRQTMFAEFESLVYEKTEAGEALTPDILCRMYKEITQKYWGSEMVIDEQEEYTWARVPHFYYNFYVYQYATGFAASEILASKVKREGTTAVERYFSFLKAGSSDYPINILKSAGVDMNTQEPIDAVSQKMNMLLNEIESLNV